MSEAKGSASMADREIVMTRTFDAPRELVWEAWTDPQQVAQWWGPRGFTTTTHAMDVKHGGVWRFVMHGPDGKNYENKITYREIEKSKRLVYKHGGDQDVEPVNFQVTVTFEEQGGKTTLTMQMLFPSAAARDFVVKTYGAIEGGKQTMERLGEYVTKMITGASFDKEFIITRVFKAPRDVVWKAWTERDRLMQWFGPKGFRISTAKLDFRPGGMFLYCMRSDSGHEMWGKWVFREIVPQEKIVVINSFSDENANVTKAPFSQDWPLEMISTMTFVDHAGIGGGTVITIKSASHTATEAQRQTFNDSHESMKMGWTGTFDQLAAYLTKS